ncbi:hypothetical protein ACFFOS_10790 [Nocardioides kongjuensis]|uniref:Uncharacterized protein n=1 Tax=Nocardioides kongjuensis TaxID=349522 RepID=A0A852RRJ0_9ACTN|nr:hypothetical protein [Nocardioides kongjuensis]NYD31480.1 hypothetical protein [Nocardioides kongjuensis]
MMFDLRVFVLAALVASPAGFLAANGELSTDEALTRLLVVMVGATAAALVVRTLWPLLAGPGPELLDAAADDLPPLGTAAETSTEPDLLDDLFGFEEPLEDLGPVSPLSE